MKIFLVLMCREDGRTLQGQCPKYQIEVEDDHDSNHASAKACAGHPGYEFVSIGLKPEIEAYEKRWNIASNRD